MTKVFVLNVLLLLFACVARGILGQTQPVNSFEELQEYLQNITPGTPQTFSLQVAQNMEIDMDFSIVIPNGVVVNISGSPNGPGVEGSSNASVIVGNLEQNEPALGVLEGGQLDLFNLQIKTKQVQLTDAIVQSSGRFSAQDVTFSGTGSFALINFGQATLNENNIFDNTRVRNEAGGEISRIFLNTFTRSFSGLSVLINSEGATVREIQSTVFTEMTVGEGHSALLSSGTIGIINNCEFIDIQNYPTNGGGSALAIISGGQISTLSNNNCINFRSNSSGNFGASCLHIDNGSIENISSSLFNSSSSAGGVGVLLLNSSSITNISDCVFEGLTSAQGGSAIHMAGTSSINTLQRSTFQNCRGKGTIAMTDESSIRIVSECNMLDSTSITSGGIFCMSKTASVSQISFSVFSRVSAVGSGGVFFLTNSSNIGELSNLNISENSAGTSGGVIHANELATIGTIHDCVFELNRAQFGGALALENDAVFNSISSSTFFSNSATATGGCIDLFSFRRATIRKISSSNFLENSGQLGGGCIMISFASIGEVNDCNFEGNRVNGGVGGAVGISGDAQDPISKSPIPNIRVISASNFLNNTAQDAGGSIMITFAAIGEVNGCLFEGNKVISGVGGAIGIAGNARDPTKLLTIPNILIIRASIFRENEASTGGGINVGFGSVIESITNSIFDRCWGFRKGGGILVSGSVNLIEGNLFVKNLAKGPFFDTPGSGGAIYVDGALGIVKDTTFENNFATTDGGAVCGTSDTNSFFSVEPFDQCEFVNNSVRDGAGGGMFMSRPFGESVTVSRCDFQENSAVRGGAIHSNGADLYLLGTNMTNNNASLGGAVSVYAGRILDANRCNLEENNALAKGGGMYVEGKASANLRHVSFTSNTAQGRCSPTPKPAAEGFSICFDGVGGALYIQSGVLVLDQCSFSASSLPNVKNSLSPVLISELGGGSTEGPVVFSELVGAGQDIYSKALVRISRTTLSEFEDFDYMNPSQSESIQVLFGPVIAPPFVVSQCGDLIVPPCDEHAVCTDQESDSYYTTFRKAFGQFAYSKQCKCVDAYQDRVLDSSTAYQVGGCEQREMRGAPQDQAVATLVCPENFVPPEFVEGNFTLNSSDFSECVQDDAVLASEETGRVVVNRITLAWDWTPHQWNWNTVEGLPVNGDFLPDSFVILVDSSLGGAFEKEVMRVSATEQNGQLRRTRNSQGDLEFSVNVTLPLNSTAYYRIRAEFSTEATRPDQFVKTELLNGSSTQPTSPSRRFHICRPGHHVELAEGDSGIVTCVRCPPGTFLTFANEASQCTPCPAGEFQELEAQRACEPCGLGEFQSEIGQARCLNCTVGRISSTVRSTLCVRCLGRFYQPNEGQSECDYCGAGHFVGDGNADCNECGFGKYAAGLPDEPLTDQISCRECPADLRVTTTTTSASLEECFPPAGSVKVDEINAIVCPRGLNCTIVGIELNETNCDAGFWRPSSLSLDVRRCKRLQDCMPLLFNASFSENSDIFAEFNAFDSAKEEIDPDLGSESMNNPDLVNHPSGRRLLFRGLQETRSFSEDDADPFESTRFCTPLRRGPLCAVCVNGTAKEGNRCRLCTGSVQNSHKNRLIVFVFFILCILFFGSTGYLTFRGRQGVLKQQEEEEKAVGREERAAADKNDENGKTHKDGPSPLSSSLSQRPIVVEVGEAVTGQHWKREKAVKVITNVHTMVVRLQDSLSAKAKIIIGLLQILSAFTRIFQDQLPSNFGDVFGSANAVVDVDPIVLSDMGCSLETGHFFKLIFFTAIFPGIILVSVSLGAIVALLAVCNNHSAKAGRKQIKDGTVRILLFLLFLLFPVTSRTIIETFVCESFGDGEMSALRADLSVNCETNEYKAWRNYAAAMVVIYPIGVPVLFAVLLYRARKVQPSYLSFVVRSYEPKWYWFELVELVRKFILTSLLVVIYEGTLYQVQLAFVLCMVFLMLLQLIFPYREREDNALAIVTLSQLVLFTFIVITFNMLEDQANLEFDRERRGKPLDIQTNLQDARTDQRDLRSNMTNALLIVVSLFGPMLAIFQVCFHLFDSWQAYQMRVRESTRVLRESDGGSAPSESIAAATTTTTESLKHGKSQRKTRGKRGQDDKDGLILERPNKKNGYRGSSRMRGLMEVPENEPAVSVLRSVTHTHGDEGGVGEA